MKKALTNLCITILIGMIALIMLVVIIDPFYHYHAPKSTNLFLYNEVYQSPGEARHFSYDTVMLGSSMTENFRPEWFLKYNENAIVLSYSGARSKDVGNLLGEVFKSKNLVKHVYIDLNDYQLCSDPLSTFGEVPLYLYDNNLLTDVKYIFNKDVIYECIDRILNPNTNNFEEAFTWEDPSLFGKDMVLNDLNSSHNNQAWVAQNKIADSIMNETVLANLDNILKYVSENSNTHFSFFYPPYSEAYWYDLNTRSEVLSKTNMYKASIEELLKYPNVDIFFFMDDYDTICNLENYRDLCHFCPAVNHHILDSIKQGKYKITNDNYEERLDTLYKFGTSVTY